MKLPRLRFTARRMMVVVLVLSPIFACVPWPQCAVLGGVIVPLLLVEEWTIIGCCVYPSIAGLLAGLLMPPIVTDCRRIVTPPPAAGPATNIPGNHPQPPEVPIADPSGL